VAFGSMLDVVNNSTPYLSDDDINAMAVYLKSLPASTQQAAYTYDDATTTALETGKSLDAGGKLYNGYCLTCHGADGKGQVPFLPPLAGNPVVLDNDPSSLVNLVLNGAQTIVAKGEPDSYRMPQYRVQLTDGEIASVLSFVRSAWGNAAPPVTADQVKQLRPITDPSSDRVIILKMR
jgi:alcohol dehydrogenase (quinone), cytochrome c subunit